MGASGVTPAIGLPQFADTDKPSWRGDINGAFSKIDTALSGSLSLDDYYVANYGTVGDGVTDDTTHIQAAIDAAFAAGGGIVHLMRGKTCAFAGEIDVKTGVLLMGSAVSQSPTRFDLKATSANSRIKVGNYTTPYAAWGLSNVSIDGNHTGPTASNDGLVWVEGVDMFFENIHVYNAAGAGMYFNAAQNGVMINSHINNCLRGIVLDNGCGGYNFTRVEMSSNGIACQFIDTPSMSNAYPFGSAQIVFESCIMEWYTGATNPLNTFLDMQCGSMVKFVNCGFSNNTPTTPSTLGAQCRISNLADAVSTNVEFTSCLWNGADTDIPVRVLGGQEVEINGTTYAANQGASGTTQYFYTQDGGIAAKVAFNVSNFITVGTVAMSQGVNGGSDASFFITHYGVNLYQTVDANHWPLEGKIQGDTGVRWWIDGNGGYHWGGGTNYTQVGSINYDSTNNQILYSGPKHTFGSGTVEMANQLKVDSGGIAVTAGGVAITAGGLTVTAGGIVSTGPVKMPLPAEIFAAGAVTADCTLNSLYVIAVTGTGSVTSLAMGTPADGQRLTLVILPDGGSQTFTWPANILWNTAAAPTPTTTNVMKVYQFVYMGAASKWLCLSQA